MNAYFNTPARVADLVIAAEKWKGTPWIPNSASMGHGVSCHNLPRSLYVGCGFLSEGFPIVMGDPTQDAHATVSRMITFLDARPEFYTVDWSQPGEMLQPGDLIGIRIRRCVDHLGVVLPADYFVHVLMHKHTDYDLYTVPPWAQRIERAWRPLER